MIDTEEVNKIALSSNEDKKLQTFDGVITYPYGTNAFKASKSEILTRDLFVKKYGKIILKRWR